MISSKTTHRSVVTLLASAAFIATLGLTGNGFTRLANAEAVKVVAPAQQGFAEVVDKVSPAVVSVRVKGNLQPVNDQTGQAEPFDGQELDQLPQNHPLKRFFREFGGRGGEGGRSRENSPRQMSQGSGFFISEDGYLVTNNHVVDDGAQFVIVLKDGSELDAKLIGKDKKTDLAVLKVDAPQKFTYVAFATDNLARVGDWVVAVGNPFGLGGTVTAGIVSALGRDIGAGPYDDFLQIDAAVNRGNSGGPAFNLNGEVVGVNTAIFSPSGGNVGIAFAIPAKTANEVVADLIKNGSIKRGWLGVQIQPVASEIADSLGLATAKGALVNQVQSDSPALAAGIKIGDVVLSVSGNIVADPKDLARKIAAIKPGVAAEVVIWRNGAKKVLSVSITKLSETASNSETQIEPKVAAAQDLANFGLTVTPNNGGAGLVITTVNQDSLAAERGVVAGDVIVAVNSNQVTSANDINAAVEITGKLGRQSILIQLESENGTRFVALRIQKG